MSHPSSLSQGIHAHRRYATLPKQARRFGQDPLAVLGSLFLRWRHRASGVVARMKLQITPEKLNGRWRKLFPNQISDVISIADPLQGDEIELEGNKLVVVKVGHTDTDDTTCLHVASIGLVVAGDAVYNGIHPFLNESNRQTRLEWIAALDKIDSLKPSAVIAGHKIPGNDDSPRNVEETRQHIRDFIRLNDTTKTGPRAL